ncbi:hypothetical protein ACQ5SO_02395 [Rhodovulum sp. DZ06]|uniref:hypothetical protein n=1 Tax=Rhodovulum sp. DZ06 TaxID=3425126 RepID=UPI003D3515F7
MSHASTARALGARALGAALLLGLPGAALAGHNNPWSSDLASLNEQFHDENQARSADTPGEDEMRGVMVQNAHGKLSDVAGGRGAAQGGTGQGEAGHGGGQGGGGQGDGGAGGGGAGGGGGGGAGGGGNGGRG